jgi:hypothetical protein
MFCAVLRFALLGAIAALAFNASAAQRTFVSTAGSDANTASNCSTTAPCRGFTAALTVTDSGGEIIVLSSGGYGPVTIDKSVSIIAPEGIYAGISVFSGTGVTIATAGVNVVLQGLTINGLGGTNGIGMTAGNSLTVKNCTIRDFTGTGVYGTSAINVRVFDSLFERVAYGALFEGGASALVSGSRFIGGTYGVFVMAAGGASTKVEVARSEATANTTAGFYASSSSGGSTDLSVKDSVSSRNGVGVHTVADTSAARTNLVGNLISNNTGDGVLGAGVGVWFIISGNTVVHNATGISAPSSVIVLSTGDNKVYHNTVSNVPGTISTLTQY